MLLTSSGLSSVKNIRHGFFGRDGGVSNGIFSSLNCGYGSNDELDLVSENRSRVAAALGAKPADLCTVHQIHSAYAVIVEKAWEHKNAPEADALVTDKSGIVLGILTADCLPVLLADGKNAVIGAAHAGWKGAVSGVLENTITAMEKLGAKRGNITAAIGPAIQQQSYEVGAEFYNNFLSHNAENTKFFVPKNEKYLFNLPEYGRTMLEKAGISLINIIAKDTCFNDNEFFSYRRSVLRGEGAYGRQISAIMMTG